MPLITWLAVSSLAFTYTACTASLQKTAIEDQLPGDYDFVNVAQMLNIDAPNSYLLNLICPRALRVEFGDGNGSFKMQVGNASQDGNRCHFQNDEAIEVVLSRGELRPESRTEASENATLREVYDHFPVFYGVYTNRSMLCPAFETVQNVTNVVAHDTGYIYTILNQYEASGLPLGESFDSVARSQFEEIKGTYTVTLSLHPDPDEELGCDYIQAKDIAEMSSRIEQLVAPSLSPGTPDLSPSNDVSRTPSPSPTASPKSPATSSPAARACFPGDALVMLENDGFVKLQDLRVGHSVLDAAGSYSTVLLFSHADDDAESEFIHILTEQAGIMLSPTHYIFANGKMVPASHVQPGDSVTTISKFNITIARTERVKRVERRTMQGLYNPQTCSGTIAIFEKTDAVLASTYTTAVHPEIAHALLAPLRKLERAMHVTLPFLSRLFRKGNEFWPPVLHALQKPHLWSFTQQICNSPTSASLIGATT